MTYLILFLVILLGGGLSLVESPKGRQAAYAAYLVFALPLLFCVAGSRSVGVDADADLYLSWFTNIVSGPFDLALFTKDPAFGLISLAVHTVGLGFSAVLATYTALCMAGQFAFIKTVADPRWLPLGFFLVLARFFISHEMTEVRVSVAIPLMSLALVYLVRRRFSAGWTLYGLALLCHFSVILVLPLCVAVARGASFRSRAWLPWLFGIGIAVRLVLERLKPLLELFSRTSDYASGSYEVTPNSLLSVYFLMRLAMFAFLILRLWPRLNRLERVMVFCVAVGLTLEASLSSNSTLSVRGAELFGLFDFSSALIIFRSLRPRAVVVYALLLLGIGTNFYRSSTKIIGDYHSAWVSLTLAPPPLAPSPPCIEPLVLLASLSEQDISRAQQ